MSDLILAQAVPHVDGMYLVTLASRLLHILSAIILVGGVFYLAKIVAPRIGAGEASAEAWFGSQRGAWAKWVGIATAVLLVTGLFNFITIVKANQIAVSYHMLGGLKILLALVLFFFAAILAGKTALAESFREKMPTWLKVTMCVGLLIVIVAGVMRSYPRTPKAADGGPALVAPTN